MKFLERLKKLFRESNSMNKRETLIERCLNGKCSHIKDQLDFAIINFPIENDLKKELGMRDEEFQRFSESEDCYESFREILIDRALIKK